jgi:hypothetical protein
MASLFKSRAKLESEILVLRQRINALRRRTPTVRSSWGRAAELVLPPLRFHQIADCKYDVGDYGNPKFVRGDVRNRRQNANYRENGDHKRKYKHPHGWSVKFKVASLRWAASTGFSIGRSHLIRQRCV